ncbi:MAG: MBL fold metallo-hydrolase [Ignavibacteria bacterium]|jgi:L-ascorbate metabolism protein UlaG (beta-lactamase superfamily)
MSISKKTLLNQTLSLMIIVVFGLTNAKTIYAQPQNNDLKITYIANEGFLLSSPTKNILIDALFTEGYGLFATPPKKVIDDIMNDMHPFNNIDVYLLTHYHKDHNDSELINEYLGKHKDLPFVTSKPSIVFINGNCFDFILKKNQFFEFTPEVNQSVSGVVNDVPIKTFGLKHLSYYVNGIDMEENMYNVSFLFEMDGIKIFHSGDIELSSLRNYIENNGDWSDKIDVAFLYYELLNEASDLDFIVNTLSPKYIVIMHVPPSKAEEWTNKTEELQSKFENILFFKNSMDSKIIHFMETGND